MSTKLQFPGSSANARAAMGLEACAIFALAAPLTLTQLAYMAIVTTDVVMMGWLGSTSLAAGSLAGHYFWFLEFFAYGLLTAIAPILSQHIGARHFKKVRRTVRQGFYVAAIVVIPCIALAWMSGSILKGLGQDPSLADMGQSYLRIMVIGFLPGLWHMVLSEFLAAHARPRANLVISIAGILVNVVADYAFMFGHFGFPAMGLVGAGVASAIVTSLMFLAILIFVLTDRRFRRYHLWGYFWRTDWPQLMEIIRLGLPIACTEVSEMGLFLVAALLMGLIGVDALAAHGIVVQCYGIIFVVPAGLMQAASVRVGRAAGAHDAEAIVRAGWIAIAMGGAYAIIPATAFVFFGESIVGLFLDVTNPENLGAVSLAVSFLMVAALLQFFDAVQFVTRGALMGLKDTRVPMIIALVCYTGLGLTLSALFGVHLGYGGQGIWLSLAASLLIVAVLLVRRFRSISEIRQADLPDVSENRR